MSRSAGPAGQDAGRPPAAGQPQGDGPEQPPGDGAGHRAGEPDGGWGRRLGHPLTLVVAGAVALVAGAAIALAAVRITGPPPGGGAAPFSSASPSAGTGASGNGAPLAALPPLSGSAGQPVRQLTIVFDHQDAHRALLSPATPPDFPQRNPERGQGTLPGS